MQRVDAIASSANPAPRREERTADDPRLVPSGEDAEDEHEAEREPGGDRGEDDEPDVALAGSPDGWVLCWCGRGGHEYNSFHLTLDTDV